MASSCSSWDILWQYHHIAVKGEKLEAFLLHSLECGLISGGVLAQDIQQASSFWHIRELHPILLLIGLIIMGGEAIISYKSLPFKKKDKKLIHLVLHGIALILAIFGVYMAFKFHNESNIANL